MTDQLFTPRSYPSTLEAERDQLRARVAELDQTVDGIYRYAVDRLPRTRGDRPRIRSAARFQSPAPPHPRG